MLLSVPAGAGHTRVAQAICASLDAERERVQLIHLDAMAFATRRLRKVYTDLYLWLVRSAPALWQIVYRFTNDAPPEGRANRLRRWVERRDCAPLLERIAELRPDAIVCTHFQPAELLSRAIASGQLSCPLWVQVTDFDLHQMWVHANVTGYFAANEEVAFRMRKCGIPLASIHVAGIPIMPAFAAGPDRAECARALGLDPAVTTFLLMGGGAGLGALSAIAERLLALPGSFQLIVLAGKNTVELAALQRLAAAHQRRLAALGYTDRVDRLMACADLAITKPGGSTTAECLAMGLPMIVNAAIPGQEEQNANYLLEHGAALKAADLPALEFRLRYLMAHPSKLADMRARARALGRPQAALHVLGTVLGQLERHDETEDGYI